ncbi:MAG: fasciclin domain-containing protein [Actinomycetota bacterium]|nr:fasciclin domain-containing protein [Actinomycetota bacterium]
MADDPVATAASNNPLLSTLSAAIRAAGLSDTLNGGGLFTVFAPINSAFDKIDRATLQGVAADTDALAEILTYHVLAEQMSSADLVAGGTFATVNGAELTVAMVGETLVINGGAAAVQCAEVPTANAMVYLVDTLLMTPTTTEAATTTTTTTVPAVSSTARTVPTTAPAGQTNSPGPSAAPTNVQTTVPVETTLPTQTTPPTPPTPPTETTQTTPPSPPTLPPITLSTA